MAYYSIKWGYVNKTEKPIQGAFDLKNYTKWILGRLEVPFSDLCCNSTQTTFPVRLNTGNNEIEYFNGTVWAQVPAGDTALPAAATFATSVTTPLVSTDTVTEKTTAAGITLAKAVIQKTTVAAVNVTATLTAAQVKGGTISSTSAAAVTTTLPTATLLGTAVGAVQGTSIDFTVDNSAGANIVTVAVGVGITVVAAVVTGGDTLTVASGTVGIFKIYFISATVAKISRLA